MERIKVIEYISNMGDGGAETLVKDYVRLIDRKRFDPVVVVLYGGGTSANRRIIEENHIPINEVFPKLNLFVRIWKKMFGWWYIPYRLKKIIRDEKAQVLHMHLIVLKDVPRIGKDLQNLRLLFTCHNVPDTVFSENLMVERKAAEILVRNNKLQMIALHNEMAEQLNRMFGVDNTIVMWNGVDVKRFQSTGITSSIERQKLGIPQEAFVLGHVGRFSAQKNHDFLVEVFFEVAQKCPNAFLLMIGAGDTTNVEDKLIRNGFENRYLILSGRTDVNEIMEAMDVFVFPSKYEGLPLALIEAQFSGLRCIASDKITKEAMCTENVIMLPIGDSALWAEAVLDMEAKGTIHTPLHLFDMRDVMQRLEMVYSAEVRCLEKHEISC